MKVLVIGELPWYPTSMGKVTYYIVKHLSAKHDVFVTAPSASTSLLSTLTPYRPTEFCADPTLAPHERALCRAMAFDRTVWAVPWGPPDSMAELVDPDVVLVYGTPYTKELGGLLDSLAGKVPVAGYFISESLVLTPAYAGFAANATVFACPTEFTLGTFLRPLTRIGIRNLRERGKARVVPHGIDLSVYSRGNLKRFSRVTERLTFGMLAKNHYRKPVATVIRAYARLPKRLRESSELFLPLISFAGNDEWDVEALVEEAEEEHGVSLRGHVSVISAYQSRSGVSEWKLMRIYRSIDVHVFPSRGESFGLPPLEAGALGIPSVLSAHPALTEVWDGLPDYVFVPCQPFATQEGLVLCQPSPDGVARAMELVATSANGLGETFAEKAGEYPDSRMGEGMLELVKEAARVGPEVIGRQRDGGDRR